MRIGVDVGGTNTDAVLMDGDRVLGTVKTPTTDDVTSGVTTALRRLVDATAVAPGAIQAVMIGTTHFTNAVIEARRLMPTAVVRIGLPATKALPPLVDWPGRLRQAIGGRVYLCHGGHEFDGRQLAPLDPAELERVAEGVEREGVRSIAISAVFSPFNPEMEQRAAELLGALLPGVAISLSHEIGRIGLLERENATIINASLRDLAVQIVDALAEALAATGITAPLFLSQNDGTLMNLEFAKRYPVATFASGPTNSMRGAAFLSGRHNCAVVDIGGTTSDVGVLHNGFPRQTSVGVEIGSVRTNFRMPDVRSLGIGGGSVVRTDGGLQVGPESVGYELTSRARCFGGATLTATDIAVAAGLADLGDPGLVADLDPQLIRRALELIHNGIADAVDRMKTSPDPIPVVVVGGGSILLPDHLAGASELVKPEHFAVANAIGAAIAQVGGEVDRIVMLADRPREEALSAAKEEAAEKAIAAGAVPATVDIVDLDEVPMTYLPGNAVRLRVKAVGDLRLGEGTLANAR